MAGCVHTQTATDSQKESFGYAVRLHIATLLKSSTFRAACQSCGNSGMPLCCLDCDFIGCPKHTSHEHSLACCLGSDFEGALWCFKCNEVVCDSAFDKVRQAEIHRAMHVFSDDNKGDDVLPSPAPSPSPSPQPTAGMPVAHHAFSGIRGLVNLGATCYVSVVLQSLVHNPLVRAFFLSGGHQRELCTRKSCLLCACDRMYTDFFGSPSVCGYGITDMLVALAEKQPVMGAGSTEQDAHEFYLMLLSEFHSSHKESSADGGKCTCVSHRTFSGIVESVLKCECGKYARRQESMVDLGLDLGSTQSTTLDASLHRFIAPEPIAHYTCDSCGHQDTTTKQLRLAEPPPVLIIQLKRFKHIGGTKGSIKVDTLVDFPLQIDVAPFTTAGQQASGRPLVYELYGVICHVGTLDTGHYTCLMKHSSGHWFNFDDVAVTPVDVATVRRSSRAYLLFYIVKWAV